MKVLVTAASKAGATAEIAAEIAGVLTGRGLDVRLADPEQVDDLGGYDAVVLGSAVYMGRWLEQARDLVDEHAPELATKPTWLFSSGPVGDPPRPDPEQAIDVEELVVRTGAVGHRLFNGKIDHDRLGLAERLMLRAVGAREGDFREWDAIDAWADEIATRLLATSETASQPER